MNCNYVLVGNLVWLPFQGESSVFIWNSKDVECSRVLVFRVFALIAGGIRSQSCGMSTGTGGWRVLFLCS